ncbi:MAG: DNA polymerase II [Nanoarchaeota archaeon]|nr:DNA polymerase II [Nanoarchaeota archaeon]
MKGFILYLSYRIIDGQSYIWLFGKLEDGTSFLSMSKYEPYFYVRTKDVKKVKIEFKIEDTKMKNFDEEKLSRIVFDAPKDVPVLRRELEKDEIKCYEADVRFPHRYLMDKDIMMSVEIDGEYEMGESIDKIYKDPEIKPSNFFPKLKVFSIDIETNSELNQLYSIAIHSDKFEKVLIDMDEEDMLEEFKKIILDEDPDIITGWNLIDFDLNFLKDKFKEYKIPFTLGRVNQACKVKVESNFFRDSKADFPGRVVLDGIHLLRMSFVNLSSYKLEDVSRKILNEGKLISKTEGKGKEIERLFKEDKKKLAKYNLNDARLVTKILKKTKAIEMTIERSMLTGMPMDRVNASIASLDSLYLRALRKRGYIAPTGHYKPKDERIKGGYVMESKPGLYDYLLVLDFKSLYPSIMRTFNVDPFSYVKNCKGKNLIKAPNGACFKNQEGIIGKIVEDLLKARDNAKKRGNELQRHAIKILLNSFFGVLANPNCRFFSLEVANAITHFGQHIIKLTAEKVKEEGYEVIYSDTDSVFILSNAKNLKEADKVGDKLSKDLNKYFEEFVKDYKRDNYMELEYEKCFVRFLMPKIRGSEAGAKKRYAGLNSKGKIEITGMEAVRGDWTELAKKFQMELLDRVFHKKEVKGYIKKFVDDIKKGKHDKLLVYRKQIRKPLDEYIKITPIHVRAARLLKNFKGKSIEYVITEDGPEPLEQIRHKLDYKHYINKQVKPIADSILDFFDISFDELLEGSKQKDLFSF